MRVCVCVCVCVCACVVVFACACVRVCRCRCGGTEYLSLCNRSCITITFVCTVSVIPSGSRQQVSRQACEQPVQPCWILSFVIPGDPADPARTLMSTPVFASFLCLNILLLFLFSSSARSKSTVDCGTVTS